MVQIVIYLPFTLSFTVFHKIRKDVNEERFDEQFNASEYYFNPYQY